MDQTDQTDQTDQKNKKKVDQILLAIQIHRYPTVHRLAGSSSASDDVALDALKVNQLDQVGRKLVINMEVSHSAQAI